MTEVENFNQAWIYFSNELKKAIDRQKTEKNPEKIKMITDEIEGTRVKLEEIMHSVLPQWNNYVSKTEYKVYYKVFSRNLSKTVDQWWAIIRRHISHLDSEKKRLEAIVVSARPTGEAAPAPPTDIEETEEEKKLRQEWERTSTAIVNFSKRGFDDAKELRYYGGFSGQHIYSPNLLKIFNKLIESQGNVINTFEQMIAVSKTRGRFKEMCKQYWASGLPTQLIKSREEFLKNIDDFLVIYPREAEKKVEKFRTKKKEKEPVYTEKKYREEYKIYEILDKLQGDYKEIARNLRATNLDVRALLQETQRKFELPPI